MVLLQISKGLHCDSPHGARRRPQTASLSAPGTSRTIGFARSLGPSGRAVFRIAWTYHSASAIFLRLIQNEQLLGHQSNKHVASQIQTGSLDIVSLFQS